MFKLTLPCGKSGEARTQGSGSFAPPEAVECFNELREMAPEVTKSRKVRRLES